MFTTQAEYAKIHKDNEKLLKQEEREDLTVKKLKVSMLLLMVAATVLTGCGKDKEIEQEEVTQEVEEATPEITPETADEAPEGKVRSNLTYEWIDEEVANTRPIAVMFNNIEVACPQTSISKAGVIYECNVEANLTRLMGIIEDWKDLEKIGSVRSCRDYFVYWAMEWDSIYCHFGGPALYVTEVLSRDDVDNLDGTILDGTVYYRTSDRKAPHNAYASGEGILKGVEKYEYSLEHTDRYSVLASHYNFKPSSEQVELTENAIDANKVTPGGYVVNKPWFEYNEEDGLYYRFQYGGEQIDDLDGEQLAVKNIIIQNTIGESRDAKDYKFFHVVDENKTGYYITNGKAIEITWNKYVDWDKTRYYDKDGNEITLNEGKTWVCIVREDAKEDTVIE